MPQQQQGEEDNSEAEKSHWNDVFRAYRQYGAFAAKQFAVNHPYRLAKLPARQREVLPYHLQFGTPEYLERLQQFKDAAIRNQFCLDCILRHAGQSHSQQKQQDKNEPQEFATADQLSKVSSVLKSLARDWSVEGQKERDMAYSPILKSVAEHLPLSTSSGPPRKVCVPGAGVMRLGCELAAKGYTVQGNEFSLYMLLASDFILNGPLGSVSEANPRRRPVSICPWLLETRNVLGSVDPLRSVQIPDENPFEMISSKRRQNRRNMCDGVYSSAATCRTVDGMDDSNLSNEDFDPNDSNFSMVAGDFVAVYDTETEKSAWDGVVACFFLDASPNVVEYLQVIHRMLKPGGVLISFGPLHWHWTGPPWLLSDASAVMYEERFDHMDSKYLGSYDYTWEDMHHILLNIGFEIVESKTGIPALYTANHRSMLNSEYQCLHFVARKSGNAQRMDSQQTG